MVRVLMSDLRRIPLEGHFILRYQPYQEHAAILYRTDCDQGILVEPDGKRAFNVDVDGEDLEEAGEIDVSPHGIQIVRSAAAIMMAEAWRDMERDAAIRALAGESRDGP